MWQKKKKQSDLKKTKKVCLSIDIISNFPPQIVHFLKIEE